MSAHRQAEERARRAARARYTENHPDVVDHAKRVIAELEAQRKAELAERRKAAEAAAATAPSRRAGRRNPVYQQLRISLAEAEAQVAASRGEA